MATPPNETPAAPVESTHISDFGRMSGALFNPKATFQDIVARPTWFAPLALLLVLSIAVFALFSQRVGWRAYLDRQFDKNPRIAQLSPEDRAKALDNAVKFTPPFVYAAAIIGTFLGPAIVAGILLLAFNLIGGTRVEFKTAFSIVAYSWMPFTIHALLSLLLMFLKSPDSIDLEHLVGSNPGAFLSNDSPKWLLTLATSFDIFTFWAIALQGIGFSAVNPKKISFAKSVSIVLIVWAIWVAVRVAWIGAFS